MSKNFWILVFLGTAAVFPAPLSAQDPDPPDAVEGVIDVINEVKLGLQVRGGMWRMQQQALPLQTQTVQYLRRPVSGDLSYTVPYFGAGLTLRFRGAEVGLAFQQGWDDLAGSTHWLQFRDGTNAIPFTATPGRATIHAEYFALDWVGVGVVFHSSSTKLSCQSRSGCDFRINGVDVNNEDLFRAHGAQITYSAYVPFRKQWKSLRLFGRIGASVFGWSRFETYRPDFAEYQDPEQPGAPTDPSAPTFGVESGASSKPDANRQFGRVGVGKQLGETATVRVIVGVERLSVSDLTKTWSYEARLEVGLPF